MPKNSSIIRYHIPKLRPRPFRNCTKKEIEREAEKKAEEEKEKKEKEKQERKEKRRKEKKERKAKAKAEKKRLEQLEKDKEKKSWLPVHQTDLRWTLLDKYSSNINW